MLDLGMPNLNGYETAARIRAQPWGQAIPLVALTGWGQPSDRQRTVAAGFNAHLVKPVDRRDVLTAIHAALAGITATIDNANSNVKTSTIASWQLPIAIDR